MLDVDIILEELGEFGLYQKVVVALLCVPACFLNVYNGFALVFLLFTPEHTCQVDLAPWQANLTLIDSCSFSYTDQNDSTIHVEKCTSWTYDNEYFDRTLVTEYDLVCDREIHAANIIGYLGFVGIVGCAMYSWLQDKIGRKKTFLISTFTDVVGSSLSLFTPSLLLFTVVRALSTINQISSWNIAYVWAIEFVGPSKRTLVSTVLCVVNAFAAMSLAGIGYLCSDYIQFGLATSLPFIALFSYIFIVDESPRWLYSVGRKEEALIILQRISAWQGENSKKMSIQELKIVINRLEERQTLLEKESRNGTALPAETTNPLSSPTPMTDTVADVTLSQDNEQEPKKAADRRVGYMELFKGGHLRRKTILLTVCWVANSLVYVAIAYNIKNIGGNFYATWVLQSAVEAPATLLNLLIVDRYGRILPLVGGLGLSGLCCLLTVVGVLIADSVVVGLSVLARFCICMTYIILYQLAGELYPTPVRGVGVGFSSIVGDVGNILMPYIVLSHQIYRMLPMVIMGLCCLLGAFAALYLPETMDQPMPDALAEAEIYGRVTRHSARDNVLRWRGFCQRNNAPSTEDDDTQLRPVNGHAAMSY